RTTPRPLARRSRACTKPRSLFYANLLLAGARSRSVYLESRARLRALPLLSPDQNQIQLAMMGKIAGSIFLLATSRMLAAQATRSAAPFRVEETTIAEVHAAMRAGTLTCRFLVEQYLRR